MAIDAGQGRSEFEKFAMLTERQQERILKGLTSEQRVELMHDWRWLGRPHQAIPPGNWITWLILTGRGWGKTRTGAETIHQWAKTHSRFAIVGRTPADVRDTMLFGESGLMSVGQEHERPTVVGSRRSVEWPNGASAIIYSGQEPDQLRGPQHEKAWCDELASFPYPEAWNNLLLGLRLGDNPQVIVTTTPKPVKTIIDLISDPTCHVTTGSTYENLQNLAPTFQTQIIKRYEGTRLGRQELYAEVLTDVPGALWTRDMLEATRVRIAPQMARILVAIDPQIGGIGQDPNKEVDDAAETGIVVVGQDATGHGYVLEDCSMTGRPQEWAKTAIDAYYRWNADAIYAEANQGGQMVGFTLAAVDPRVPVHLVYASRGKYTRAEPVSALYSRGWIHHVGFHADLESQLVTWVSGDKSPDRLDAMVWGLSAIYFPTEEMSETVYDDERVSISPF